MKFKKLIAMALAFAMALTLAVPAMAANAAEPEFEATEVTESKPAEEVNVPEETTTQPEATEEVTESVPAIISGDEGEEQIVPAAQSAGENLIMPMKLESDGNNYINGTGKDGTDYIYSKEYNGKGWSTWNNVIFLEGASADSTDAEVSGWHLVIAGKWEESAVQEIHLVFTSGRTHDWQKSDGFSTNDGGKNPGLMVVAPLAWGEITAESYIRGVSNTFTISGYYKAGTPKPGDPTEPDPICATLNIQKLIAGTSGNVAPTYESFKFEIKDEAGAVLGTVTTNKTTGLGNATVNVTPGKTYTIREVFDDEFTYQADKYPHPVDVTVAIPANTEGSYTADVEFVNIPAEGETSTVFQINKFLNTEGNPGVGFVFDIIAEDGTVVGTMTSDEFGFAATEDFYVAPGKYIIREQVPTDEEYEYEPVDDIEVMVDEVGVATFVDLDFDGTLVNVQKGKLNVTAPTEAFQKQIKQVHETLYEVYSQGTLVSHIASVSGADLPDGITGSYLKNGMTYLTIDRAKLEAAGEEGVDIGIATSDPQKGNKTSWNTPAPAPKGEDDQPTYNLKIEDGKLVVTSELPNIGVRLYSAKESPKGPQDFKGSYATKGHLTGEKTASFNIPTGKTFKVFVHIEDTAYETNKAIGCKLVSTEIMEFPFECTLTTTVTDANGNVVDTTKQLSAGTYTVTVTNDMTEDTWSKAVEVKPGETTNVIFDKLVVSEMGEPIIECGYCQELKMIPLTPATPVEPDEEA